MTYPEDTVRLTTFLWFRGPWLVAIPVILLVEVGLFLFQYRPGIQVTVQNKGSSPKRWVVLHATGATHELSNVPPRASAPASVNATGEFGLGN